MIIKTVYNLSLTDMSQNDAYVRYQLWKKISSVLFNLQSLSITICWLNLTPSILLAKC